MHTIGNEFLLLNINENDSSFSVTSKEFTSLEVSAMQMNIIGGKIWRTPFLTRGWNDFIVKSGSICKDTPHGSMELITLERGFREHNIKIQIIFALPEKYPFVLWKVVITNLGSRSLAIDKLVMLETGSHQNCRISFGRQVLPNDLAFFSNGWQSWSYSATYGSDEKMRISKLKAVQGQQWYNPSTPIPKRPGQFVSDFFGVIGDRKTRHGWVAGFLSQKQQFGTIAVNLSDEPTLQMWADSKGVQIKPAKTIETDWAYLQPIAIDDQDALGIYYEAVKRENDIHLDIPKPTGWCSWYEFYTHIDDANISRNLEVVSRLKDEIPMQLFQIDDGYETQIGDWLTCKSTFKDGLKPHAEAIQKAGLIAGLWQAPFIVHKASRLCKDHPDWMLKAKSKRMVNSGFNWNSFTTALDLTNSDALDYAGKITAAAVNDWGYQYLKLDFLYAAALRGVFKDSTRNRAEILYTGMKTIRQKVGKDVFLLGCGAPLGPMLGIVDGMRIGSDVLDKWKTSWFGANFLFKDEPNTPSACNAIQNIISRSGMHNRWWFNDPDVLLIREHSRLTVHEIQSLAAIIALSGGMLLLSDDLTQVGEERLQIAKKLIPQLDQRPWVLDWFDQQMASKLRLDLSGATGDWYLISISNWKDNERDLSILPEDYKLPDQVYWGRSFWDGELMQFSNKKPLIFHNTPAHATKVIAVRLLDEDRFTYLGSSLHISQGCEVRSIKKLRNKIELMFELGRNAKGNIDCFSPSKVKQVKKGEESLQYFQDNDGILRFDMDFNKSCKIEILV